jgi:predicted outer membrane repeat protein
MKKTSILLFLVLLAFGQTVWSQNSQTVYLTDANPVQSLTVDETVEMVWVYASFPGMPDPNTGQFELTVPQGCIMKLSGEIASGQAGISWDGGSSGGYSTDFSGYWAYASQIGIQISSSPGEYINMIIEVAIYNPNAIREEDVLRRFINHTEVSDLGVVADITLSDYLAIGQDNTRVVAIDLNGHILQRNLTSATGNGCVIAVAQTGNLTLTDGTVGGGWNNSTTGNIAGGIMNKGILTLNNITIDNCKGDDGGGINNANGATLTITGGTISNCLSKRGGGGIVNKGTATISGCSMSSNTATTRGGAIWSNSSLTVSSSTMSSNQALAAGEGGDGGAIHIDGGTANLSNVTISNNTSKDAGGIYVKSEATLTITGTSIISNNTSSEHGGGGIVSYGTTTLNGCTFSNNTAHTRGGAIWSNNSLTVGNCSFNDNEAVQNDGGAIHLEAGTANMTDVAITGNTSKDAGGIYVGVDATLTITGTNTICDNTSSEHGGGGIVAYNTTSISGCTFSGNSCQTNGGGIWTNNSLILTDCTFSNNHSGQTSDQGGAVFLDNDTLCSATLTNCNFTGNNAKEGGAVFVSTDASLTVDGGNFTDNVSIEYGGGIANYGTLEIKGNLQVKDNTPDNIYLKKGKKIEVTGAITSGANSIGVNMEWFGVFTNGYGTSGTSEIPFFAHGINDVTVANGECTWVVGYIECSWNNATQSVVHTTKLLTNSYQNLCDEAFANGGGLQPGWYIVNGNTDIGNHSFECVPTGGGVVHIILCDNASINLNGLYVNRTIDYNRSLHIYCQSYGERMGKLTSINTHDGFSAGIGGSHGMRTGNIYIHGGDIHGEVNRSSHSLNGEGAGIGSAYYFFGESITIYDGKIYAKGGWQGAGIGGGADTSVANITIYSGYVVARGGLGGAGIGTGEGNTNNLNVLISGGTVDAAGGDISVDHLIHAGAGIGTGGKTVAGNNSRYTITITGGNVSANGGLGDDDAFGGENRYPGAGIGTGGNCQNMQPANLSVNISGGEVYAHGGWFKNEFRQDGAGIGGGYGSPGGNVVISGGTVRAIAGTNGASAIGCGDQGGSNHGTISFPDLYSVQSGSDASSLYTAAAPRRDWACHEDHYAIIGPCEHIDAEWRASSEDIYCANCTSCYLYSIHHQPYTFQRSGLWNTTSNWFKGFVPYHPDAKVAVKATAVIPDDCTVHVSRIDIQGIGRIILEDGGQLIHNNEGVVATVEKNITAYNGNGGYYLLASPVADEQAPSTLGMLENNYDLYGFDQSQELEWRNYEQQSFNLENGIGYLYANNTDTNIAFNGVLNRANANVSVPVTYDANAVLKGLNLVGNPFACNAYLLDEDNETMPFYKMSSIGDTLVAAQAGTAIKPCEGVFVVCPNDGQTHSVVFTTTAPENIGEAEEVPSMLLPVHDTLVHQDASLINNIIQTIALLQGWNWWSTNLDITLDNLKAALVTALPGATSITIKSQTGSTFYDGSIWRGTLNALDVAQMYEIKVPSSCTITQTGIPIDPSEHPVTIAANGNTWIGFPFGESKSLDDAFVSFPVNGDIIKSKDGSAFYNGTMWRGVLTGLQPGQGYIYKSASGEVRTFTYPVGNR